jgi:hypothetical protein
VHPDQYLVGRYGNNYNNAGGVDFADCVEKDACNNFNLTFVTADAIRLDGSAGFLTALYGVQILPR